MDGRQRGDAMVIALFLVLAWLLGPSLAGSCRAAKLCCQGRDSGCVIQKASPNAIIESPRDKPCYCDHACLRLGDCCDDFNETCAVSDCVMSDWSSWTECDNKCGPGHQTRQRYVVRPARNGGKPCAETEQRVTCQNYDACRRRAKHFQLEEVSFASANSQPSFNSNFIPQITSGYCAAFTILKISRGCRRRLESFHEGSRVCVWCRDLESDATASSFSTLPSCQFDRQSLTGIGRWELTNSPRAKHCHGKWMGDPLGNCSRTNCFGKPIFVFL